MGYMEAKTETEKPGFLRRLWDKIRGRKVYQTPACRCEEAAPPSRIQWFRFLPKGLSLKEHIFWMMDSNLSDKYIMANCVAHAKKHGHADTKALRKRIASSIRSVRHNLITHKVGVWKR